MAEVPVPPADDAARHRDTRRGGGLAHARELFLTSGPVRPGVVRDSILASWRRSRECKVAADHLELPFDPNLDRKSRLAHGADEVISAACAKYADEPISIILTDAAGVVLDRRTGDSRLQQKLDNVRLAPGFSYAEQFAGTNGIGTTLEGRGPAHVFGHEHYVEHLEDLACAGAPIRHPTTGKVLGILDLTCWRTRREPGDDRGGRRHRRGDRGGAAGAGRPPRARPVARLPAGLPPQPGLHPGDQHRPGDDERQRPGTHRSAGPGGVTRAVHSGSGRRQDPGVHHLAAQRCDRAGALQAELERVSDDRRRRAGAVARHRVGDRLDGRRVGTPALTPCPVWSAQACCG